MTFLPSSVHGVLDYLVGAALIAAPWIFQFSEHGMATGAAIGTGVTVILYSLFTDYERGVVRALPWSYHLALDTIGGIFLAASPWILGFADEEANAWVPHVVVGLAVLLVVLVSERQPRREPGTASA
jgi:hypothetical protein